ncbi:MAG TPA: enolase C-terminal domain-like protein [Burkholderiales bacterium]|nr:enolase C-terminal domain-like protein [Burkholderiales bacterium]
MPDTTIVEVLGRRVWTVAGESAFEAEVHLACGTRGRAIAAPAKPGRPDPADVRSAPSATVAAINGLVAAALHGLDARRQEDVDSTLFKLSIGGDAHARRAALCACSIATARAAARAVGLPLHRYLRHGHPTRMPLPVINVFAAGNEASPIRALAVAPFAAEDVDHALELGVAIHRAALDSCGAMAPGEYDEMTIEALLGGIEAVGFAPGEEVGIIVDVGAARLLADGRYAGPDWSFDADGWSERIAGWIEQYPIAALEEPFADAAALARFAGFASDRVRIIGDESLASDAERIAAAAVEGALSGTVLRPEAAGTLSELRVAFDAARIAAWPVFMGAGEIEVEDASLVHIATAWQSGYVKLGTVGHGASLARWNEALRIEASLRPAAPAFRVEAAARMVH